MVRDPNLITETLQIKHTEFSFSFFSHKRKKVWKFRNWQRNYWYPQYLFLRLKLGRKKNPNRMNTHHQEQSETSNKKKVTEKKIKKKPRNPKHERELILHTSHVWKTWRNYLWDESKVCKYGGSVVQIQDRVSWYWFKFPTSRVSDDFLPTTTTIKYTKKGRAPSSYIFSSFSFCLTFDLKTEIGYFDLFLFLFVVLWIILLILLSFFSRV